MYTDDELNKMAEPFENGITAEHLDGAEIVPGSYAWLFDVVPDWDAFSRRVEAEGTTPERLVRRALEQYLA